MYILVLCHIVGSQSSVTHVVQTENSVSVTDDRHGTQRLKNIRDKYFLFCYT